ncbi:hypothetical protein Tsubulata_040725 [Turnera subulata]|uniref:BZIP domain-containing protein n=1 Tax=Turnera subulata TaxID=218843 RepID=A0A9Q0GA64_9ROSI|nr:hypothetical protein Tsubulata_040725 [Turnera subulata]
MDRNSWYNLTLTQLQNQLGNSPKPLGSMNLDELLTNVWNTTDPTLGAGFHDSDTHTNNNNNNNNKSCLQRQASFTLVRALTAKTVDQVWREIQVGQKKRFGDDITTTSTSSQEDRGDPTLGELTLEDFLVQAGLFAEASVAPPNNMDLLPPVNNNDDVTSQSAPPDALEKTLERRLRRKIKNRESAARSRARKQAYHNELVSKVSHLEEKNLKLMKDKEFEKMILCESSPEPKYQLRRTSSASF